MKTYLPALGALIVAAAITIISGVIHGRMTERWGTEIDRVAPAEILDTIPEIVGDEIAGRWEVVASEPPFPDSALKQLECAGYISRAYQNSETGERVTVTIILGPPGPISVHVPETGHVGRAVVQTIERQRVTIKTKTTEEKFWAVNFGSRKEPDLYNERFFYAWSIGGPWVAPEESRISFGGSPYVYKIQVVGRLLPDANMKNRDPVEEFLKVFVPAAKCGLVPYDKK